MFVILKQTSIRSYIYDHIDHKYVYDKTALCFNSCQCVSEGADEHNEGKMTAANGSHLEVSTSPYSSGLTRGREACGAGGACCGGSMLRRRTGADCCPPRPRASAPRAAAPPPPRSIPRHLRTPRARPRHAVTSQTKCPPRKIVTFKLIECYF